MARILILYGTTDGQTARIARSIGATLGANGADVDVVRAGVCAPSPKDYAAVIVAASLHGGRYQTSVTRWVRAHAPAFGAKPTAFISVCLGVLQSDPAVQQEIAAIIERFLRATRWRPTITKVVAGALLYRQYNWFKRWVMKRIVAKAGGDTDTSRDYEYTDWNDLRAFAEAFARSVGPARVTGADNVATQETRVA